ncbi:MAG: quinoprotein dehydrogenase-associated SoxYZ-like carrier [Proteobacteria bacterium]|nr:quinoprotein dehydrogenase-associated SoxYZ-like carrier [Pseudomonadota bacterium]
MKKIIVIIFYIQLVVGQFAYAVTDSDSEEWLLLKESYFPDITIIEDHSLFELVAPPRAEDAAFTPVRIKSDIVNSSERFIKELYLFIDKNPVPLAGIFHFNDELDLVDISTRLRVDRYTYIRAVIVFNTGEHYLRSHFIKASGGCSAPPPQDNEASELQMGKMRIRIMNRDDSMYLIYQVKHPNYSGLQIDPVSRGYIPAHYINRFDFYLSNEIPVLSIESSISISMDPVIRFRLPEHDINDISVVIKDTKNQQWQKDYKLNEMK